MARRRANNEGSIFKRKDGKWRAQISLKGKRISFLGDSQKECQDWIRRTRYEIEDQGVNFKGKEMTIEQFLIDWLMAVSSSRAQSTYNFYSWITNSRIIPNLGKKKLDYLKPETVQQFYDSMIAEGVSQHQIISSHRVLRTSMNHAVKLGYINRNPTTGTLPPKSTPKEMQFLTDDQVKVLFNAAVKLNDRYFNLYYLAVHTGMRQAELLGLKWEDVDWSNRTIAVKRQVQHFKGKKFSFIKPKTKAGNRTIILGDMAMEILRKQRENVNRIKFLSGEKWQDHDLIFPTRVGTPVRACNLRRNFRRVLEESGLDRIRFHDLRHTAATLMLNNGVPLLVASRRLGHSKPSTTMDVYGHLLPSKQEEAASILDNLVNEW